MQAVSILAPALAPLAIKLIDKLIFDDNRRPSVPKIVEVPAPPQYICCCGRQSNYESENRSCSTCSAVQSSRYQPSKNRLTTKSTGRSSSTSDAYDTENIKVPGTRHARTFSDSGMKPRTKTSRHSADDTLAILASHLQQEISTNSRGSKISPHYRSKSSCSEKLSPRTQSGKSHATPSSSSGSCKTSRKSGYDSKPRSSLKCYRDS